MKKFLLYLFLLLSNVVFAQKDYTVESIPNPKDSPPYGYVSNPDGVLDDNTFGLINSYIRNLEDSTTIQIAVVVVNSIGDLVPREFATQLFRHWGIGQAENNNGLLILLVINQRRMEFEVGYGLEGILTDGISKRIQMEYMVPYAKEGDYNQATLQGVVEVSKMLANPKYREEVYAGTDSNGNYAKSLSRQNIAVPVVIIFFMVYGLILIINWKSSTKNLKKKPIYVQHYFNSNYNNTKNILIGIGVPVAFFASQMSTGNLRIAEFWIFVYLFIAFLLVERRFRLNSYIIHETDKQEDEPYKTYNFLARSHSKGWFVAVIFFPLPFLLYWFWHRWQLRYLRNIAPVDAASGLPMHKLSEKADDAFLENFQLTEEKIKSVDYDVWQSNKNDNVKIIRYENFRSKYTTCSNCGGKTFSLEKNETLQSATYSSSGLGKKTYGCKNCNHTEEKTYTIPMKVQSSSSSSGGSGGGGGGSFGGGSSGGGGAGSSW